MFYPTLDYYWNNREKVPCSLNTLYRTLCITKQAVHKHLDWSNKSKSEELQMLLLIHHIQEDHPTMCCRDMYYKLLPSCMGRDAFERFCKINGLMSERKINNQKTTDSSGVKRFDNLLTNLKITSLN